jgi:ketosteroid isomerase-like protein
MSDPIDKIKDIYAAFGRGDIATILASLTDDISWEFEAPAELSWSGIRHAPEEAAGFFDGIAAEHADPNLEMTEFFATSDAVAAFGRYQATVKATGIRVDTPVAHYFKFREDKIARYINVVNSGGFVEANRAAALRPQISNLTATVQEIYAAFGGGDVATILSKLADDVVWESEGPAVISFSGIRRGKAEARGFFEALGADHSNPQLTITEYVASGDTVMTIGRYTATVNATGKKFDSPIAHYWKFRDGKVIRYVGLANTAAALEALQRTAAPSAFTIAFNPKGMSMAKYAEVMRRLELGGGGKPAGRLFHTCYGPEDALRVLDVWASMEQFERFGAILMPILVSLEIDLGKPDIQPQHNGVFGQYYELGVAPTSLAATAR